MRFPSEKVSNNYYTVYILPVNISFIGYKINVTRNLVSVKHNCSGLSTWMSDKVYNSVWQGSISDLSEVFCKMLAVLKITPSVVGNNWT